MTATTISPLPAQEARGGALSAIGLFLRTTAALGVAAVVTVGLFMLMRSLIWVDVPPPPVVQEVPPIEIAMVPPDEPAQRVQLFEELDPVDPPPLNPRIEADPSENPGTSPIGPVTPTIRVEPDADSMRAVVMPPPPLTLRVPPAYPRREQAQGREGSCIIQYDILANGRTANARALDCDSVGFERASLAAVDQWRHAVASGVPGDQIVRQGVQTRLDFRMEQ